MKRKYSKAWIPWHPSYMRPNKKIFVLYANFCLRFVLSPDSGSHFINRVFSSNMWLQIWLWSSVSCLTEVRLLRVVSECFPNKKIIIQEGSIQSCTMRRILKLWDTFVVLALLSAIFSFFELESSFSCIYPHCYYSHGSYNSTLSMPNW